MTGSAFIKPRIQRMGPYYVLADDEEYDDDRFDPFWATFNLDDTLITVKSYHNKI